MDRAVFRPAQRHKLLTIGWICAAVVLAAVGGVVMAPEVGGWLGGILALPGLVALFLAPLTLNVGYGRTVLTPHGIRTNKIFSRHSCPWVKVLTISTEKHEGGRGTWDTWVVVKRRDGSHFKLAAPFDSGNGRDPRFYERVSQIHQYLARVQQEQLASGTDTD